MTANSIDIVDAYGALTGKISTPQEACNQGLWHRGVRVFICTPSQLFLVQKRVANSIQYPNLLDVGVSGFVDSGEHPREAAIREVYEETGIHITQSQLQFLTTYKYNHRWLYQGQRKISRTLIYGYLVRLPYDHITTRPQKSEVSWITFMPLRRVEWLINQGELKQYGRLITQHAYYRRALHIAIRVLRAQRTRNI